MTLYFSLLLKFLFILEVMREEEEEEDMVGMGRRENLSRLQVRECCNIIAV